MQAIMTNKKSKRAMFRQLAQHGHIKTARQLAEELEQPYLPLVVSREARSDAFQRIRQSLHPAKRATPHE
jgi:hypothetical protein